MSKRSYIKSKKRVRILIEIIMIIITAVHLFPVFNLVCSSLKTSGDLMYHPVGLPHEIDLSNYQVAWETLDYLRTLFNTTFICVVSILLIVLVGAFAAYPIARYNLKFNKVMYYVFLALIMIPGQAILIPLVRMYYRLGLVNTYHGMVIVYIVSAAPFAIFLYTGFIKTIPKSLEESAIIDGCGPFGAFIRIVFPLLKSVTTTVIILNIMSIWNDFLMPMLILQKKEMRTLTPSIFNFFEEFSTSWNYAFAASVLVMLPGILIFLLLQKHFVEGMVGGSVQS